MACTTPARIWILVILVRRYLGQQKKKVNLASKIELQKWTESLNSRLVIQDCCISFHMIKAAMATKESSQPSWWTEPSYPHPVGHSPHHDPSPATHSECGYGRPQLLSSQKLTLVIVDIQSTQFAPTSCFHTKKNEQIFSPATTASPSWKYPSEITSS